MVLGSQRIALLVVQSVAIGRYARHENVALQAEADGADRGFHLRGRGAALPIVGVIENDLETAAVERLAKRGCVVAVGHQIFDAAAEVVLGLAMQYRDFVTRLQQRFHQRTADEQSAADNQYFHIFPVIRTHRRTRCTLEKDTTINRNIPVPGA